jgi:tetratricopeptide (TPR) repeat protein
MKAWIFAAFLILSGSRAWCDVPKATPETKQTNSVVVAELIQRGKQLYESGKNSEAKVALKKAIKLEPSNKAARYYLDLVKEAEYRARASAREEQGDSRWMYLTDPPKSVSTHEWITPVPYSVPSAEHMNKPPAPNPIAGLYSKKFELDIKAFNEKLQLVPDEKAYFKTVGEITTLVPGNRSLERHEQIKTWARGLGVKIDAPGESIFYNDVKGLLLVRASESEIAVLQKAIAPMAAKPDSTAPEQKPRSE